MIYPIILSIFLKFLLFIICYGLILKTKKIAHIDSFWALTFLPEFFIAFYWEGFTHGSIILFLMVLAWALRLSYYLGSRTKTIKEDKRYSDFTKQWPKEKFNGLLFKKIILMQFLASTLMSSCFYIYLFSPSFGWSAPFWNVPMLGLFILGLIIEITADEQMKSFKLNNSNKDVTYTGGIWKYVKYPNYTGEILIWLSFGLLALPFTYGIFGLISPIAIFYFLTFVTGIPYLEKQRAGRKSYPYPRPSKNYLPFLF